MKFPHSYSRDEGKCLYNSYTKRLNDCTPTLYPTSLGRSNSNPHAARDPPSVSPAAMRVLVEESPLSSMPLEGSIEQSATPAVDLGHFCELTHSNDRTAPNRDGSLTHVGPVHHQELSVHREAFREVESMYQAIVSLPERNCPGVVGMVMSIYIRI